jgi:hypothetical protein
MRTPVAATSPYLVRCGDGTTDTLEYGVPGAAAVPLGTGASGMAQLRVNRFIKIGSADVIFNGNDPTKTAYVRFGSLAELMTAWPIDVEGDAARSSVYFTSAITTAGAKLFFATLDASALVPARIYRTDVTEATLDTLTMTPMPNTTKIADLSTPDDLVRWDPLLEASGNYFGAGIDVTSHYAKLTWLNSKGDVLVRNFTVFHETDPTLSVNTAAAVPMGVANAFVPWVEDKSGGGANVHGAMVLCTGGI